MLSPLTTRTFTVSGTPGALTRLTMSAIAAGGAVPRVAQAQARAAHLHTTPSTLNPQGAIVGENQPKPPSEWAEVAATFPGLSGEELQEAVESILNMRKERQAKQSAAKAAQES